MRRLRFLMDDSLCCSRWFCRSAFFLAIRSISWAMASMVFSSRILLRSVAAIRYANVSMFTGVVGHLWGPGPAFAGQT